MHDPTDRLLKTMVFNNLRYAVRGLGRSPGFASITILTLALGIGITSAIFSVVYGVLLKPLPYGRPDQLCLVWKSVPGKNLDRDWTSYPTYQDWRRNSSGFDDLAAFLRPDGSIVNLTENGSVEQVQSAKVSANFFMVLGVPAMMGRTFMPRDVNSDPHVALVSYDFWKQHFGGAAEAIGKEVSVDDVRFHVIGVMPPGFAFPAKESQAWLPVKNTQMWLPINSDPRWDKFQQVRLADAFGVVGRLKARVAVERAQAEMTAIAGQLGREHPDTDLHLGVHVIPLSLYLVGSRERLTLLLFFGAVLLVLLIACANAAGLFFSRMFARRKWISIQTALGARRAHILRQALSESTVVAFAAGVLGLGLAALAVKALLLVAPPGIPGLQNVRLNAYVLIFTLGVTALSGTLSGLAPAWRFSAADPHDALKEKAESGRHANRMHAFLVFVECALAIMLLTGTGLLLRSVIRLQDVDLGFRPDRLLSVNIFLHGRQYDDDNRIRAFVDEAIRRVDALPGVRSAAIGGVFLGRIPNSQLEIEDGQGATSMVNDEAATWTYVSEDFFKTLGIPVLRGRSFASEDGPGGSPVVIVNQTMARRLWAGEDPIGKHFKYDVPGYVAKDWLTVIGVAGDTARNGPEAPPISVIYYPVRQKVWDALVLMVRTDSDPGTMQTVIANEIHLIDKTIPRPDPSTVQQQLWELGSERRFQIEILGLFSFLAIILAGGGTYAVMAYTVGRRTREIGIRMALGARPQNVLMLLLRQSLLPVVLGLICGIGIAFAVSRALASLLYGISSMDPVTYLSVCALLFGVAAIAAYVPARRAMKVDPLLALRYE